MDFLKKKATKEELEEVLQKHRVDHDKELDELLDRKLDELLDRKLDELLDRKLDELLDRKLDETCQRIRELDQQEQSDEERKETEVILDNIKTMVEQNKKAGMATFAMLAFAFFNFCGFDASVIANKWATVFNEPLITMSADQPNTPRSTQENPNKNCIEPDPVRIHNAGGNKRPEKQ